MFIHLHYKRRCLVKIILIEIIFLDLHKKSLSSSLPIFEIRDHVKNCLIQSNQIIIHAPTGTGKSTWIPQFLTDDILEADEKLIVLQPRRIATRMLASYISTIRGKELGTETGYQVRLESKFNSNTRILFQTEGILLNQLLSHELPENIGAIVFDEFHERHLETDLSLSLAINLQKKQRPQLRLIVMSATLDIDVAKKFLNNAHYLKVDSPGYPVTIDYEKSDQHLPIWQSASQAIVRRLDFIGNQNVLVFMPGQHEIRKTIEVLRSNPKLSDFEIYPLHGSLTREEQLKAVSAGKRKIIVSTNVAETSLTIPEIVMVVDSGLARVSRFDYTRGINTIFTENISSSSANQRAGRAGRTAPGKCIRLWGEFENTNRVEQLQPEIHRTDLTEIILRLIASGIKNIYEFEWLEKPALEAIQSALELLLKINCIDPEFRITATGKEIAQWRLHPREGKLLQKAKVLDCLPYAVLMVSIGQSQGILFPTKDEIVKQERLHYWGYTGSDLLMELNAWLWAKERQFKLNECKSLEVNANIARQCGQIAIQLLRQITNSSQSDILPDTYPSLAISEKLRECIFYGYQDLIAIKYNPKSEVCQLTGGRSASLHPSCMVREEKLMVATEIEESYAANGVRLLIKKASVINESWLESLTGNQFQFVQNEYFDQELQKVQVSEEKLFMGIVISRKKTNLEDLEKATNLLYNSIVNGIVPFPQWDEEVEHFVRRVGFASKHSKHIPIPNINDEAKELIIKQSIYGCKSTKEVVTRPIWPLLKAWFNPYQLDLIDRLAPISIQLPGRKKPTLIRYDEKGDAVLSEVIQAFFDCKPIKIADGQVEVVYELLSPARRPVQITRDLIKFWETSYPEIRKEMKGRYPKHDWR